MFLTQSKNADLKEQLKYVSNDIDCNDLIKKINNIEDRLDKLESN